MDEKDPQAVKRFLEPLMQRLGVSVIVTDDLSSFKQAAEALQLEHQFCHFLLRRWVGQAVYELKASLPPEWVGVAEEVRQILRALPIKGDKHLDVPWANNPTEHVIGKMKMRVRTVRGD